mgnify:CR=1 FL=1
MRAKRAKRTVEDDAFGAFLGRVLEAYGRRASTDVEAVASLAVVVKRAEETLTGAIRELRKTHSCAEIATRLGVSRQAVQKR